jgi:hypothetical protein
MAMDMASSGGRRHNRMVDRHRLGDLRNLSIASALVDRKKFGGL